MAYGTQAIANRSQTDQILHLSPQPEPVTANTTLSTKPNRSLSHATAVYGIDRISDVVPGGTYTLVVQIFSITHQWPYNSNVSMLRVTDYTRNTQLG